VTSPAPLPRWVRLALTVIGGASFAVTIGRWSTTEADFIAGDLTTPLLAARALAHGEPPYLVGMPRPERRLLYPVPALLVVAPLAPLPLPVARVIWTAIAGALLTFAAVSRFGGHGLAVVVSWCAVRAMELVQWSPVFLAGALIPPLQLVAAAKPTIALIAFAYRPSWWPIIGAAVLVPFSFAVRPTWFGEWWQATHAVSFYAPALAIWRGGGPLLLLAAIRWKRPEARLLLAFACVPHNYVWYDQLLLFLVPATALEVWTLSALTWVSGFVGTWFFWRAGIPEPDGQVAFRAPIVALLYLPCLVMVLRRPNEGTVPAWLERSAARWPAWLRGRPMVDA
jgi:hypothetical protein